MLRSGIGTHRSIGRCTTERQGWHGSKGEWQFGAGEVNLSQSVSISVDHDITTATTVPTATVRKTADRLLDGFFFSPFVTPRMRLPPQPIVDAPRLTLYSETEELGGPSGNDFAS
jgi:hypothetical protein